MVKRFLMVVCLVFCASLVFGQVGTDAKSALKQGSALESANKPDEALKVYQDALKAEPAEELYRKAGSLLGKMQKYDDAEILVKEGLAKHESSSSLMNLLGFIHFKKGARDDARNLWKKVLEKDANNSFAKEWVAKVEDSKTVTEKPAPVETTDSPKGSADSGFNVSNELSKEEQEKLAEQLYNDMKQTDEQEIDTFISTHKKVIEKCPQTNKAEESCWRLSNLYLISRDQPDNDGAIRVLEHLIKTYPNSDFIPGAKNRLISTYKDAKETEKMCTLYAEMFQSKDSIPDGQFRAYALEYGEGLLALGKRAEAKVLFEEILQRNKDKDDMNIEVQCAEEHLKELQ